MENLYALEQLAIERRRDMERESFHRSLERQAASRDGSGRPPVARPFVRSRAGSLLVRLGLYLGGAGLAPQEIGSHRCVCVTVEG